VKKPFKFKRDISVLREQRNISDLHKRKTFLPFEPLLINDKHRNKLLTWIQKIVLLSGALGFRFFSGFSFSNPVR